MFHNAIKLLLEVLMQLKRLNNSSFGFSVEPRPSTYLELKNNVMYSHEVIHHLHTFFP